MLWGHLFDVTQRPLQLALGQAVVEPDPAGRVLRDQRDEVQVGLDRAAPSLWCRGHTCRAVSAAPLPALSGESAKKCQPFPAAAAHSLAVGRTVMVLAPPLHHC